LRAQVLAWVRSRRRHYHTANLRDSTGEARVHGTGQPPWLVDEDGGGWLALLLQVSRMAPLFEVRY
jgi:hypothetical protein